MNKRFLIAIVFVIVGVFLIATVGAAAMNWSTPQMIGSGQYTQDTNAEIAADQNGNVYVVWTTYPHGRQLYFNSFDGTNWSGATRPHPYVENSFSPDITVSEDGDVHVVWQGNYGACYYGMVYTRYNGITWSPASCTGLQGGLPSVAVTSTGQVFVANRGPTATGKPIQFVYGDGINWSIPATVTGSAQPDVSVDENDQVYLAYADGGVPAYRTWNGSSWSNIVYVENGSYGCMEIEMFHNVDGSADYFCMTHVSTLHWHHDGNGWQGPNEIYVGPSWKYTDATSNGQGLAAVILQSNTYPDSTEDVFVRLWDGKRWLPAENASNTLRNSYRASVGISSNQELVAVWADAFGFEERLHASIAEIQLSAEPIVSTGGPYYGNEGDPISLSDSTASDDDGDPLTYNWSVDSSLCSFSDANVLNPNITCQDNGIFNATLTVSDGVADAVSSSATVEVANVAPTIDSIVAPAAPVNINDQPVEVSVGYSDPGTNDTHDVSWVWGDLNHDTHSMASPPVSQSHNYSEAGAYSIEVTVTDDDGGSDTVTYEYVVIYDPEGGFVTGGGWIVSPENACPRCPESPEGKATFGFVSKYKKGAQVPTGNTQFRFKAGGLDFHSSSYEWLVIAGCNAKYKGEGTINGEGAYKFMLTATDGDILGGKSDEFRIRIWDGNGLYYDNKGELADDEYGGTELGGGNIKIHKAK